jgi:hypothetical protein
MPLFLYRIRDERAPPTAAFQVQHANGGRLPLSGYGGDLRPGAGTFSICDRHKSNNALMTTVTMGPWELAEFAAT